MRLDEEDRTALWASITMFILLFAFGIFQFVTAEKTEIVTEQVTIEPGDTLYNTVARTVSSKNNVNEVVSRALRENGIKDSADIQPYDKITITYKK